MDLSIVLRICGLLCILLLSIMTSSSSSVNGLANKKGSTIFDSSKTKNLFLSLSKKIDVINKIQKQQKQQTVVKEYKNENIKSDTKKNTKKPANSQHKNQITIILNETAILIGCLVAIAAAIALSVAIPVSVGNGGSKPLELLEEEEIASAISFARDPSFAAGLPQNDSPFPVTGPDWPNDGCGDASVRYKQDGKCYPVLRRGPCPNPLHWIAVDPINLSGQCRPRLCGKGRVFVGGDGLCHDMDDALECVGGRRLYYTAFGDPICDCPDGQYPFPGVKDSCVPLFTRGPCPSGQVVAISPSGSLKCTPNECQSGRRTGKIFHPHRQLFRNQDGLCYALGGTCPSSTSSRQFYGYNVFRRQGECIDTTRPDSPYFASKEEDDFLAITFNQIFPEYDQFPVFLGSMNQRRNGSDTGDRRQDETNTSGIFQLPGSLLNPCRSGARNGNNFKCTTPTTSTSRRSSALQAVRSAFGCRGDGILQATSQCGNSVQGASCGPSYQFNPASGQCRKAF